MPALRGEALDPKTPECRLAPPAGSCVDPLSKRRLRWAARECLPGFAAASEASEGAWESGDPGAH